MKKKRFAGLVITYIVILVLLLHYSYDGNYLNSLRMVIAVLGIVLAAITNWIWDKLTASRSNNHEK